MYILITLYCVLEYSIWYTVGLQVCRMRQAYAINTVKSQLFELPRESYRVNRPTWINKYLPTLRRPPTVSLSMFSLVGSRGEPNCHHWKFADWIRLNPSVSSRHRTEKSPRTDNKSFIVFQNPNHNNRQSLIKVSWCASVSSFHFTCNEISPWGAENIPLRSPTGGIEAKGTRMTLRITDPVDLNRDVLKVHVRFNTTRLFKNWFSRR